MAQIPKKKRLLPKNITEKSHKELDEKQFGKRAKRQLDRLLDAVSPKPMKES